MAKTELKEEVRFQDYTKDLEGAIITVQKDGVKLRHKIHNVACSIIKAWGKREITDQRPAQLFTALAAAAGYHGKALADWIALKTPLAFSKENEAWYVPADVSVNGDTFKAARNEPFWELSPPKKPIPFLFVVELERLINRGREKAAKIGKGKAQGDVDMSLLKKIVVLVDEHKRQSEEA